MNAVGAPSPEDYAIVVGVDDYEPGIPPLTGCVNDARLFRDWLVDPAGGGLSAAPPAVADRPPHVRLICSPNPVPVKNLVEDALNELAEFAYLCPNGRIGRRLYLWFSGHGVAVRNKLQECAALMADAGPGRFTRSIPGREAADNFCGRALFDQVVLVMACCRTAVSGVTQTALAFPFDADPTVVAGVRQMYGFAARWSAATVEKDLPHPLFPPGKVFGAPGGGPAPPVPESRQGVFSHVFLKGLWSAVDDDGKVTAESLAGYIRKEVPPLLGASNNMDPDIAPADPAIVFTPAGPGTLVVGLTRPEDGFQLRHASGLGVVQSVPGPTNAAHTLAVRSGNYLLFGPAGGDSLGRKQLVTVIAGGTHHVNF